LILWKTKSALVLIATVTVASFILNIFAAYSGQPEVGYFLPWNRLWELSLGGALAYVQFDDNATSNRPSFGKSSLVAVLHRSPFLERDSRALIGGALLVIFFVAVELTARFTFPGWWALLPCIGTTLLISAGPRCWINRRILSSSVLVFVGAISYPLYLWHWPLLAFAQALEPREAIGPAIKAGAIIVAFLLAYLTYRFLEMPVRTSRNKARLVFPLCASLLLCGTMGYLSYTAVIPARLESRDTARYVRAATEDWLPGTHDTPWTEAVSGLLTLGTGSRRVLFLGDSNLQQYYPRINYLLSEHPMNAHSAVFATHAWCAPSTIKFSKLSAQSRAACDAYLNDALEYARQPEVDTVVLGACWYCYFISFRDFYHLGDTGPLKPGADQAIEDLRRTIGALLAAGKRVYIVLDTPLGPDFDPRQMISHSLVSADQRPIVPLPPRAQIQRAFDPITARLLSVGAETGATVIDPMKFLCSETVCPATTPDGEPMYHDLFHLRPAYVRDNVRFLDGTVLDDLDPASAKLDPGKFK
jgi:SGNH domain (fused to AT3 domains)